MLIGKEVLTGDLGLSIVFIAYILLGDCNYGGVKGCAVQYCNLKWKE